MVIMLRINHRISYSICKGSIIALGRVESGQNFAEPFDANYILPS